MNRPQGRKETGQGGQGHAIDSLSRGQVGEVMRG
jgi:hypothetical protein